MESLTCPVCGDTLRESVSGCSRCPMNGGCDMVCCETCGYETVAPRSRIVDLVHWFLSRMRVGHDSSRVS